MGVCQSQNKRQAALLEDFKKAGGKWITSFIASKDEKELALNHHCIDAYHKDAVFSISNPGMDVNYTASGRKEIQAQWHTVRTAFKCVSLGNAQGQKIKILDENTVLQSFDNVDLCDKEGKMVMQIAILGEVWRKEAGTWKVLADYVMVKPPQDTKAKSLNPLAAVVDDFKHAGGQWINEFIAAKNEAELKINHHCIDAYRKEGVFSICNAGADINFTALGRENIQKQWHTVRTAFGCVQLANAQGQKITMLNRNTILQSFDNVDLCDKDGNLVMQIRIIGEIWTNVSGSWKVLSDYVMVKPTEMSA